MSEVLDLQRSFAHALLHREQEDQFLEQLSGSSARNAEILAVYRGNLIANTCGALKLAYPILEQVLGEECFAELARLYWHEYPTTEGDLNTYGRELAELIPTRAEFSDLPWAVDLARLEWRIHCAGMCADHTPVSINALTSLSADHLANTSFVFQPGLGFIESEWPIVSIWQQHQADWSGELDLTDCVSETALVHRLGLRVQVRKASLAETSLIFTLRSGKSLNAGFLECFEALDNFDPQRTLQQLFEHELIIELREVQP